MAFDATPVAQVTARDRVMRLRDFLAELPDEKFDIAHVVSKNGALYRGFMDYPIRKVVGQCGTAACICGWADYMLNPDEPSLSSTTTGHLLGLDYTEARTLFMPYGYDRHPEQFTRARAVRVLDHYLETGEVSWDAVP